MFDKIDFTSHSGEELDFKIECDALTDKDIETLAYIISKRFTFSKVFSVPCGGLRLGESLKQYCIPDSKTVLIVDDVLTTGASMEEHKGMVNTVLSTFLDIHDPEIIGVVIFARGNCASWIKPIFTLWEDGK